MQPPSEGSADLRKVHFENGEDLVSLSLIICIHSTQAASQKFLYPAYEYLESSLTAETIDARNTPKQVEK